MRKRNWHKYNRELVQRGSINFLIDENFLNSLSKKKKHCGPGRPTTYPLALIKVLLLLKIYYRLPYRGLEGFSKWVFSKLDDSVNIPTYSLICKRMLSIKEELPKLSQRRPQVIILDASGMKVMGEGEWKVKIHGKSKRRQWIKLHIAIDERTQEIVGQVSSEAYASDSKLAKPLINQVKGSVKKVLADGAYDTRNLRDFLHEKGIEVLISLPKNACYRGVNDERDKHFLEMLALGGVEKGRSLWGKLSGYSRRALVETTFSRIKRLFGDRLFSKSFPKQALENHLRCALINLMPRG